MQPTTGTWAGTSEPISVISLMWTIRYSFPNVLNCYHHHCQNLKKGSTKEISESKKAYDKLCLLLFFYYTLIHLIVRMILLDEASSFQIHKIIGESLLGLEGLLVTLLRNIILSLIMFSRYSLFKKWPGFLRCNEVIFVILTNFWIYSFSFSKTYFKKQG